MKQKQVWSLSGGKDSTAMCLLAIEKGEQVDDIVFVDTGMEFEELYVHLDKFEKVTGKIITRLKAEKSFEYLMFEHKRKRGNRIGDLGYGWPHVTRRWCTRYFKLNVLEQYARKFECPPINHIGYGLDEFKRYAHKSSEPNLRFPLVEWRVTEAMALKYCYDKGFDWGGLYQQFSRVSCWCCPLQSKKALLMLYLFHPIKWSKLKEMDSKSSFPWPKSYTLEEAEEEFKKLTLL